METTMKRQIPHESRPSSDHLHYPSRVANCLDILKEIEKKRGGLVLDIDNRDEGGEGSKGDSAQYSWISRPGDDQEGDEDKEVVTTSRRLTLTPESGVAFPSLTSDLS
ncbi:uncharacterized protein A4U43_C06F14390 [Asparagus officinalis]|uniref:Uncharacterized protein n=1 Tax=Asparagus officinalis TaxID=4686 RepID=A0A5P1EPD3_ASPOF|nr:uncharacterized protein A4U43_C06F14390 [Asparagus officinalis]